MGKPVVTIVGYCTSTTANLLAVFEKPGSSLARIYYRIDDSVVLQRLEVPMQLAEPYLLATFQLQDLPAGAGRIHYSIRSAEESEPDSFEEEAKSFRLPRVNKRLRFALVSCNGEYRVTDEKRRYRLWRTLKQECDAGNIDFILHVGDQIYADAIRMRFAMNVRDRMLQPDENVRIAKLTSDYRKTYVQTWSAPDVAVVLATCSSVMMWDDHEIYDGYGSHDDDKSETAGIFFRAAQTAFLEFQCSNNPEPLNIASQAFGFVFNESAFLILDGRSNRSYVDGIVLGAEQMHSLQTWLSSMSARKLQHLYVIAAIPIVHVPVVGFMKLVQLIGWGGRNRGRFTGQLDRSE